MPQKRLHACHICGKKFATLKGVYGHQRMHSGLQRVCGLKDSRACSHDQLRIASSLRAEIEEHDQVVEAAMNLVMLSQRVCDFAAITSLLPGDDNDDSMEFELTPCQEKILHRNELKIDDFGEVVALSGGKKSRTCSRGVPRALRSKLQRKTQFNYKCNICEKIFGCSQAIGSHQRLHRSIKAQLACKEEETEDGNSLFYSSEANKTVSQSSSIEVSQEEKTTLHCDQNIFSEPSSFEVSQDEKILHRVEPKLANSGFSNSNRCSKNGFSTLHSPLRSKSYSEASKSSRFKSQGV